MAKKDERRALVLGIGNILMGDEGLGVRTVELFENSYEFPPGVECVDGGVAGVALLEYFKTYNHIIIVDAVASGAAPATIKLLKGEDIKGAPPAAATAHDIGVKELIALSRFEGANPGILLIGIVPEEITPGMALTPAVEAAMPKAAEAIMEELCRLGFEVRRRHDA